MYLWLRCNLVLLLINVTLIVVVKALRLVLLGYLLFLGQSLLSLVLLLRLWVAIAKREFYPSTWRLRIGWLMHYLRYLNPYTPSFLLRLRNRCLNFSLLLLFLWLWWLNIVSEWIASLNLKYLFDFLNWTLNNNLVFCFRILLSHTFLGVLSLWYVILFLLRVVNVVFLLLSLFFN